MWSCCLGRQKEPEEPLSHLSSDYHVVARLMQDIASHLPAHWDKERRAQRQRQLILAVNRGDSAAVAQLCADGADPSSGVNPRNPLHLDMFEGGGTVPEVPVGNKLVQKLFERRPSYSSETYIFCFFFLLLPSNTTG